MGRGPVRFEVVDEEMAKVLRAKTPAERLAIGFGLWRSARVMLSSMLRSQHPDWSDERVNREVSTRLSHGSA
jgi:hypothetical protein